MGTFFFILALIFAGIQAIIGLMFLISCIWEREQRATIFGGIQFALMSALVVCLIYLQAIGFFETGFGLLVLVAGLLLAGASGFSLTRKSGQNTSALDGTRALITGAVKPIDERDIVFARNRALRPGSKEYQSYYKRRPEYEEYDAERRQKGGPLGHPGRIDQPYSRPNVDALLASLSIPLHLSQSDKFNPPANPILKGQQVEISPQEASQRIKGYTRGIGADLVGICKINPLWIYSHRGEIFNENWNDWGRPIETGHTYAIVFATEMNFDLVGTAPHSPTAIASMNNYAQGAYIATQLAAFIANMGYAATANHLRHYDALLVPLAVDAGLGETGRMGYLMTKNFGPRVRLGAVTTDLALIPDKPIDIGALHFCRICKKCAHCCPSKSIPLEDWDEVNGTMRWKLNAETCFDYWGKVGTDCNICMRVCPWSHANTLPHRLIRELITRNRLSRVLFNLMDDIFYGRKPKPKQAPDWARYDGE